MLTDPRQHWAWNTWLDAVYPPAEVIRPGSNRGPCEWTGNNPLENQDNWAKA